MCVCMREGEEGGRGGREGEEGGRGRGRGREGDGGSYYKVNSHLLSKVS